MTMDKTKPCKNQYYSTGDLAKELVETVRPYLYSINEVVSLKRLPEFLPIREFNPSKWICPRRKEKPDTFVRRVNQEIDDVLPGYCKNWNVEPEKVHLFLSDVSQMSGGFDTCDELTGIQAKLIYKYLSERLPTFYFQEDITESSIAKVLRSFLMNAFDDEAMVTIDDIRLTSVHSESWSLIFYLVTIDWIELLMMSIGLAIEDRANMISSTLSIEIIDHSPMAVTSEVIGPELRAELYQQIGALAGETLTKPSNQNVTNTMVSIFDARRNLLLKLADLNRLQAIPKPDDKPQTLILKIIRDQDGRNWQPEVIENPPTDADRDVQETLVINKLFPVFPEKVIQKAMKRVQGELEEINALVEITKDAERLIAVRGAAEQEKSNRRLNFLFLLGALAQLISLVSISQTDIGANTLLAMSLNTGAIIVTVLIYRAVLFRKNRNRRNQNVDPTSE